ncbi:hypothetical protein EYF80_050702 [Liparis tanakae]|uniref:Uncharacterized protein n=1 Tax=Liparis tanakae TaxID=230148 RepID=A0A4Z2FD91_9TELE|nr:hypothetical protein EYF80_050702 [Liparis tanakae]
MKDGGRTRPAVSAFVRQRADGGEQLRAAQMPLEEELRPGVAAELDHAHPGPVRPDLKGAGRRGDEAADVFEVGPADAPGAVHQEHHVGHGAGRAFWELNLPLTVCNTKYWRYWHVKVWLKRTLLLEAELQNSRPSLGTFLS